MLIESGLPKTFWNEAMATAAYTISQCPATAIGGQTPYQALFKRHVDPTFFRPFGCTAYAIIPKDKRTGKLAPKSRKCVLLGYSNSKGRIASWTFKPARYSPVVTLYLTKRATPLAQKTSLPTTTHLGSSGRTS